MSKNFIDDIEHPEIKNFAEDKNAKKILNVGISVCVTIKNRTFFEYEGKKYWPFKNFIKSLVRLNRHRYTVELIITDFNSTDIPLESWIYDEIKFIDLKIIKMGDTCFSRGRGLNRAVKEAKYDYLFVTDADMLLCEKVVQRGIFHLKRNRMYFPIALKHVNSDLKVTRWFQTGTGNMMVTKVMFNKVGGYPEYTTWGKEDKKFYDKAIHINKYQISRERIKEFYHQFHPTDLAWKNRFAENKG